MQNNKRQFRELAPETKQKISQAMRGRPKSFFHKQHISQGMKDYWKTVPSRNNHDNERGDGRAEEN